MIWFVRPTNARLLLLRTTDDVRPSQKCYRQFESLTLRSPILWVLFAICGFGAARVPSPCTRTRLSAAMYCSSGIGPCIQVAHDRQLQIPEPSTKQIMQQRQQQTGPQNLILLGTLLNRRLQLLTVSSVTNDESWGNYVARREAGLHGTVACLQPASLHKIQLLVDISNDWVAVKDLNF